MSCIKDKDVAQGAATQVYCAIFPGLETCNAPKLTSTGTTVAEADQVDQAGVFYDHCRPRKHKRSVECKAKQKELYDATARWVGITEPNVCESKQ